MDYDDGRIACTDDDLLIRWYYFPAGSKRIPYDRINCVVRDRVGKGRIWGTGDLVHWRNLDPSRPRKTVGLLIDNGRRVKPVVTPDRPEDFLAALAEHGVAVSLDGG